MAVIFKTCPECSNPFKVIRSPGAYMAEIDTEETICPYCDHVVDSERTKASISTRKLNAAELKSFREQS